MSSIPRAAVVLVTLSVLVAPAVSGAQASQLLTVERIYADPPLWGSPPTSIRWLPDSKGVTFLEKRGEGDEAQTHFVVARLRAGSRSTLCIADTVTVPDDLASSDSDKFSIGTYLWADDGDLGVFRFKGDLFTIDSDKGAIVRRTRSEVSEENVSFSPDGRHIAFTRHHDLWVLDIESNTETQLTHTGNDSILNGVLDWVYMEELFTRGNVKGYWWSPDSRAIAYFQINDSPVGEFPIVDFLPAYNRADIQHYPKAGSENPLVRIGIYRFDTGSTVWTDVDTADDSYIARFGWLGDSKNLAIAKLNRNQDRLQLLLADTETGESQTVLEESKDTWVNVTYNQHFFENGQRFIWNAERDGNSHLYLYKSDGTLIRQITAGPWEVTSLDAVDEKRGHVYFTATERSILGRQLYRVGENGRDLRRVSRGNGTHSAVFSPDRRYYIDTYSNSTTPPQITVHDATGKKMFGIYESEFQELTEYGLPAPDFFRITSKDGIEFQCQMIRPTDFDESKQYPVLVYLYGGPQAQEVVDKWGGSRYLWHAMMAQRGYIVFTLDNRGSYGRGTEWEDPILKNLGETELADQMTGVAYLKSLPYVAGDRIGIWGWSYGGYMTCMAMFKTPGVFCAGAAVAPVTDWHFYDTIYTERYMKRPQDNEEGYENSSPLNFVDGLAAPFLLVHGTADDNVHLSNTVSLVDRLIDAGKDFDLMLYPRQFHGIAANESRIHLYRRLTAFFDEHFRDAPPHAGTGSRP